MAKRKPRRLVPCELCPIKDHKMVLGPPVPWEKRWVIVAGKSYKTGISGYSRTVKCVYSGVTGRISAEQPTASTTAKQKGKFSGILLPD